MPDFEGVVILGMHRSGTSLITRLVSLTGASVCRPDDVLVGRTGNPRGHWESRSMNAFNDELLDECQATWYCPPEAGSEVVRGLVDRHVSRALATLLDAHPHRPFVWKDPRTSVLMPFWGEVLRGRVAYVVAVRHPLEVSDSLASRNGFTPQLSLALWERYTREALLGATGSPTIVCTYDEVLREPLRWCEDLSALLESLGMPTRIDRRAIEGFVSEGLRHSQRSWDGLEAAGLSPAQTFLAQTVTASAAQAEYSPPALGEETSMTETIFGEMRRAAGGSTAVLPLAELPSRLVDPELRSAGGQGAGQPPISILVSVPGEAGAQTTGRLAPGAPPGSELVVVGEPAADPDADADAHGLVTRHVPPPRPEPSPAALLAAGSAAATGRLVVMSAARLERVDSRWGELLAEAFASRRLAGASFMLAPDRGPQSAGRRFIGRELRIGDLPASETSLQVPLLPEILCAFNREVLETAGGLDGEFQTAAGAIAEISLRLWRMGFRCRVVAGAPARFAVPAEPNAEAGLHDRLRIARLHLGAARLRRFEREARRSPDYEPASAALVASDLDRRRAAIEGVCVFDADAYFTQFPASFRLLHTTTRRSRRAAARVVRALSGPSRTSAR